MTLRIMNIPAIWGLAALGAVAASATPTDGTYRVSGDADCSAIGEDGGALRITDGLFEGVDSQCQMTNPVDVVDMDATLYTMTCSAGDTSWTERALLMTAAEDGGLIMLWNGYAFRYERCEPGEEDGDEPGFTEIEAGDAEAETGLPPPRIILPRVILPEETASDDREETSASEEVEEESAEEAATEPDEATDDEDVPDTDAEEGAADAAPEDGDGSDEEPG
jgi:hypothetical protein